MLAGILGRAAVGVARRAPDRPRHVRAVRADPRLGAGHRRPRTSPNPIGTILSAAMLLADRSARRTRPVRSRRPSRPRSTMAGGRPTWPIRPTPADGLVVVGTTGFATAVVEASSRPSRPASRHDRRGRPARRAGPDDARSSSTTRPCATAPRARTSPCRWPTSCASRGCSTSTGCRSSRAAGRARTPRTSSSSRPPGRCAGRRARLAAFGSTRHRVQPARRRPQPARAGRRRDAGRDDLRQELAAPRHRGAGRDAGREPRHDRATRSASSSIAGARSSTTPSTSSTATRPTATTPSRRLRAARQAGAADARPVRHERRHADRRAASRSSATSAPRSRRDPDAPAVTWGIHTHNDAELAVANSMAAVAAGVRHVQATINGYGERCGNANMVSILANLALKTPHVLVPAGGGDLAGLTELSRSVAEIANIDPERLPAVRRAVGVRPQGRRPRRGRGQGRAELPAHRSDRGRQRGPAGRVRARRPGQHLDPGRAARPSARGRRRPARAVEADQAARGGRARVRGRRGELRAAHPAPRSRLRRRRSGSSTTPCLVEQRDGRELLAEATVKVEVDGEMLHTAADGNGPVNALDARAAQGAPARSTRARRRPPRRLQGAHPRRRRGDRGADPGHHRLDGRRPDVVDHGQRHQHHRGVRVGPRRLARVRDLEVRLRAAPPRRAPLHDRCGHGAARRQPARGATATPRR